LQIIKAFLDILEFRHVNPGQASGCALCVIGRDLNLTNKREHVGGKAIIQQHTWVDLALNSLNCSLV